jgi:hypothetical protein
MKETQGDQSGNEIQILRPGPKKLLKRSPIQADAKKIHHDKYTWRIADTFIPGLHFMNDRPRSAHALEYPDLE